MTQYTNLLVAGQGVTVDQVQTLVETYKGVVEKNGGTLSTVELRRATHLALLDVDASPTALVEIARQMQASEDMQRFTSLKVDRDSGSFSTVSDDETDAESPEAELDTYSVTILSELRRLNDHLESCL